MTTAQIQRAASRVARRVACAVKRNHGPFHIPKLSTADSAPVPAIYCLTCGADCSRYFMIRKSGGAYVIVSCRRGRTEIIGLDDGVTIDRGYSVLYRCGRFAALEDY